MSMNKTIILSLAFATLVLGACTGPVIMGTDAAVTYATKPSAPPPADTKDQIAEHQSWCYETMGDAECYSHPQDVAPGRLINVDPASSYPLDVKAYHDAVVEQQ